MFKQIESLLPDPLKANLMLKAFSITKVPLLFATGAYVREISSDKCVVSIPFLKLVKNHLGSLYFGALAIGADACVGLLAAHKIHETGENVSLVFKSFKAEFHKRAEGRTDFICEQGNLIDQLIKNTLESRERQNQIISAYAEVDGEKVASFELELSLKIKSS